MKLNFLTLIAILAPLASSADQMGDYVPRQEIKDVTKNVSGETTDSEISCNLTRTKDNAKLVICDIIITKKINPKGINLSVLKKTETLVSVLLQSTRKNGDYRVRFTIRDEFLPYSYVDVYRGESSFRIKLKAVKIVEHP